MKKVEFQENPNFEGFITKLSSEFINISAEKVDAKIHDSLAWVGELMGADRSFLFQFNWKRTEFRITHLWEADRIHKDQTVRGVIVKELFPWLSEYLLTGTHVLVSDVEELNTGASRNEYGYCQHLGIKSFIVIPIQVEGAPLCAVGLDAIATKRQWSDTDKRRLLLIGEILANTISRKHAELELKEAYAEVVELKNRIEAEKGYLQKEINIEHNFENIIGQSEGLKYVLYQVEQVAKTDSTVLILGETGTGKELVARAIHRLSDRRRRALLKVNCAALPGELIESELFGREKGAFTGATERQIGRFEIAKGSTIFLDEIGEIPIMLQAKLLRVLESGGFERLGSPKTLHTDARIIASTNRDLEKEAGEGRFREDLWYRLKVFPITVPPLRQRKEDIPLLANWFVTEFSRKMGKKECIISRRTMQSLKEYHWPGNIRELKHTLEGDMIRSPGKNLTIKLPKTREDTPGVIKSLKEMERDYILEVLKATKWKIGGENSTASALKINPSTLRSRMKKLRIKKPELP